MGFTLDKIVPWGRSYEEYAAMFNLGDEELGCRILGCGDGPAGFNAELTRRGGRATSIDPIYKLPGTRIRRRIAEAYDKVMAQMRENQGDYVWSSSIPSVDELGRIRMAAMDSFLEDYETGRMEGRYIEGELPSLPLQDDSFDIALSSHFLFLYGAHLSAQFHVEALVEMLRVAREARVYPLLSLDGTRSPYIAEVSAELGKLGFRSEIHPVSYEFQRGANEMLRVSRPPKNPESRMEPG